MPEMKREFKKPEGPTFNFAFSHYTGGAGEGGGAHHAEVKLEAGTYHVGRHTIEGEHKLVLKNLAGKIIHEFKGADVDNGVSTKHLEINIGEDGKLKVKDISSNGTEHSLCGAPDYYETKQFLGKMDKEVEVDKHMFSFFDLGVDRTLERTGKVPISSRISIKGLEKAAGM